MYSDTLVKVSNWNSFRVNQNYSDLFRRLYPSQCESFRNNPKNVLYLVWWKTVKNQSNVIRFIPRHQLEWIRTNPKPSFQSRSTRINPNSDWSHPNFQTENRISDWFGFIRIDVSELIGLSRIDFWPFFIERNTKGFSDWFGMIRIGSDTGGMNRNSSDWLGINFNPILSPRYFSLFTKFCSLWFYSQVWMINVNVSRGIMPMR